MSAFRCRRWNSARDVIPNLKLRWPRLVLNEQSLHPTALLESNGGTSSAVHHSTRGIGAAAYWAAQC